MDTEPRPELPPKPLLPAVDRARAIHLRRQLETAAEHGIAMLAALGLPQLVEPDFVQVDPVAAGDAVEAAIAALDALDDDADAEPWLGWAGAGIGRAEMGGTSDREDETELDEDDGTSEPTLGAPERHPYVVGPAASYYEPANGSFRRYARWESQVSWAQGSRLDGEGEPDVGYCLPEGDGSVSGEDDDDGLSKAEGDHADDESTLGAPAGDGDQRHWAQGPSTSNDPEADDVDLEDGDEDDDRAVPWWDPRVFRLLDGSLPDGSHV